MKRMVAVCLASGVVGFLLGSAPSAMMQLNGYEMTKPGSAASGAGAAAPGPGGMPAGGCPMMAARMKAMQEADEPRPKRELTTLVRKLDLLTGDIGITLTGKQAAAVNNCLRDIEKSAKMSDDDAKAKRDQLMAVLDVNQKARVEAIGLPRPAPSDGPGMGAEMPGMAGGMPGGPGMMGGEAAPEQDEKQNPFQQDAEGKAVKSLRQRLAPKATPPKTETPKPPPAKAEIPKPPPAKADASKSPAAKS